MYFRFLFDYLDKTKKFINFSLFFINIQIFLKIIVASTIKSTEISD